MTNGIRIEDIDELLGLFHRLEELLDPKLPAKNTQLWEKALQQAKEELDAQVRKRQAGLTLRPGRNLSPRGDSETKSQEGQNLYGKRISQIAEGKYREKDSAYAKVVDQAKTEELDVLKRIDHLLLAIQVPLQQFPRAKASLLVVDWKKEIRDFYGFLDKDSFSYQLKEAVDALEALKLLFKHHQPSSEKSAETERNAAPSKVVNINNFTGILGDVQQAENLQVGDNTCIYKQEKTEEKKKGILRRIPYWIYILISFLAAFFAILDYMGWLEPIKAFIAKMIWHK